MLWLEFTYKETHIRLNDKEWQGLHKAGPGRWILPWVS